MKFLLVHKANTGDLTFEQLNPPTLIKAVDILCRLLINYTAVKIHYCSTTRILDLWLCLRLVLNCDNVI